MFRTVPPTIISSFSLYTQQWYMSYRFADSLRAGSGRNLFCPDPAHKQLANLYDIHHCCECSEKLLMMDRGTVRNMQIFIPKINLRNQLSSWFQISCYLCCFVVSCVVLLLFVLFCCYLYCSVVICIFMLLFVLFCCYLYCSVVICIVLLLFVLFCCYLCCSVYCLSINVHCTNAPG